MRAAEILLASVPLHVSLDRWTMKEDLTAQKRSQAR